MSDKQVIELPRHSSFSQSSAMLKCSLQHFLERRVKVPTVPTWATVGGSAVHAATEQWDRDMLTHGVWDTSEILARLLFIKHFEAEIELRHEQQGIDPKQWRATGRASKQYPNKRDEFWWRENGPLMVSRWFSWRTNNGLEIAEVDDKLAIEIEFEVEIGGVILVGAIDRVFDSPHGFIVTDIKTGATIPKDHTQLELYVLALGLEEAWAYYWMGESGATTPPVKVVASEVRPRLEHLVSSTRKMQELGFYLANPGPMCSACGVRDYCYAMGGGLANTIPQPWEVVVKDYGEPPF